jgi:hypothetical protein
MQPGQVTGEDEQPALPDGGGRAPGHTSSRRGALGEGRSWLTEPRTAVLLVLGAVVFIGGGRRLLMAWASRKAVARLTEPDVTPEEIEQAARFGRAGLYELFRIMGEAPAPAQREAAWRALASLWAGDQLIAEEEKALVRRGFTALWHARRRYPRAIRAEIPIRVTYGIGPLGAAEAGITQANLEWSHRITGARRAGLEEPSAWTAGSGLAEFSIVPSDFEGNGPHRVVLQPRVRTKGLTESWELDLPHMPFGFEFDPRLEVNSLLALPDEPRGETMARSIRLEVPTLSNDSPARFLPLNEQMTVRNPPCIEVATPLPCDLAHNVFLEIEGVAGRHAAGTVLLGGQGSDRPTGARTPAASQSFPLAPIAPLSADAIDRPGKRRLRVILEPDADRGWTDPAIRSIWPGTIETDWVAVEIMRR